MYHPTRRGPRSDCFRPRARSFAAAILMVQGIPSQEASPTTSGALTHPRPHAHIWVCTYAWTHSPTQRAIHAASHAIDHRPPLGQVHKREAFSRGRGLEYGVNEAPKRATPESTLEEVLFFCDIDMHFTYEFLYRCKANAIPGDSLYFPISFSLFKGKSVQVVHENGDWRTYGLGMVCISTTDFLASKGFSKTITGWGGCGVVSGYICPFAESPVNRSHTTRVFSRIECEWHTDFSTTAFVTACTATAAYSLCKLM
eukprot:m.887950 g.887950  ORF g.887950 m.887950 type:complete len:256 (-) comp23636_c0_seq51:1921-2688(-)